MAKQFITLEGFDFQKIDKQIDELFGVLSTSDKNKVLKIVFKQATSQIRKSARKNRKLTRTRSTRTRNALTRSIGVQKLKKYYGIRIGFRRAGKHIGEVAHLIDQGTLPRLQRKTGRFTGKVKGTKFWTNTIEQEKPHIYDNVKEKLSESFEIFAKRYNKKYSK